MDNKAVWLACLHEAIIHTQDQALTIEELMTITNKLYQACLQEVQR